MLLADVGFTSLFVSETQALLRMAANNKLGIVADPATITTLKQRLQTVSAAAKSKLWDTETRAFVNLFATDSKTSKYSGHYRRDHLSCLLACLLACLLLSFE